MMMTGLALWLCAVTIAMLGANAASIPSLELRPSMQLSADSPESIMWYDIISSEDIKKPTLDLIGLAKSLGATTFLSWVEKSNLTTKFSDPKTPYTIFLPTEAAFKKMNETTKKLIEKDPKLMEAFILYHSVNGTHFAKEFGNDKLTPSLNENKYNLRSNRYPRPGQPTLLTVNGNVVSKTDQLATNGAIHVVDGVMFPYPIKDILTLLTSTLGLPTSQFSALLNKAHIELKSASSFTVFAPSNVAMKPYMNTLNKMDPNDLSKVLKAHIVEGTYYEAGFYNGLDLTTMTKTHVFVMSNSHKPTEWWITNGVHTAMVEEQLPYSVTNGVVYVVNNLFYDNK